MYERMMDKSKQPTYTEMSDWIGQPIAGAWTALLKFLVETYDVLPTFNAGGQRYGWNLQHRLGGRPLCEMYPEQGSFTTLVILGKVELEQAMQRNESFGQTVRKAVLESPRYHDGCWMYIRVFDPATCMQDVEDIEKLILIKKKPSNRKKPSSKN